MLAQTETKKTDAVQAWLDYEGENADLKYLRDENEATRHKAALGLLEEGNPRDIGALLAMIEMDRDTTFAGMAALQMNTLRCLRLLGDSVAVEFLCAALNNPALLRMRGGSPLPALVAKALTIGRATPWIAPLCSQLADYGVERVWAARLLGEIGFPRTTEALCAALRRSGKWTRLAAAKALGQLRDVQAVEALCAIFADDAEDLELRHEAGKALGLISDSAAVPTLCAALKIESAELAGIAAWALGEIGDKRAVDPLIEALESWGSNACFVFALQKLNDVRAVVPLCEILRGGYDKESTEAAAEALGSIGDVRAVEPLCRILEEAQFTSSFYTLQYHYARLALLEFECIQAVEPLCQALQSPCNCVRATAAEVLGKIGDPSALPALKILQSDKSSDVRLTAAVAISKLSDDHFTTLYELAVNPDPELRKTGLCLLASLGDRGAIPCIEAARRSPDPCIRLFAASAAAVLKNSPYQVVSVAMSWEDCLDNTLADSLWFDMNNNSQFRQEVIKDFGPWEALCAEEPDRLLQFGKRAAWPFRWLLGEVGVDRCFDTLGPDCFRAMLWLAGARVVKEEGHRHWWDNGILETIGQNGMTIFTKV
jgi:HEAT repeat protein